MDLKKLSAKAAAFNAAIDLHEATAIQQSEKVLVELNRSQMLQSKDATDATITPAYSKGYAALKGFSNPDLKATGNFQKDMFLIAGPKEWFINSIDWKSPELSAKYSEDIFGIAPSNREKAEIEVSNHLYRLFKEKVCKI